MLTLRRGDGFSWFLVVGMAVAVLSVSLAACQSQKVGSQKLVMRCDTLDRDGNAARAIRVSPFYPPREARAGVAGYVLMRFNLTEYGEPTDIAVVDSEPSGTFDRHAVAALQHWRYCPTNEVREDVEVRLEFNPGP